MTTILPRPFTWVAAPPTPFGSGRCSLPCSGEIFIWRLDLPSLPLEPLLQLLTDAERRGEKEGRRYRTDFAFWLKARAALRGILSAFTGQPGSQIAIAAGGGQKPALTNNPHGLHFSVSRSKDYALIVLGRAPLGIDIEAVRPGFSWHTIATHWFHPREQARLAATPEGQRIETFFQIWTQKEAFFKGLGIGLDRESMTSCFVAPDGRLIRDCQGPPLQAWRLQALSAPSGYKAALASIGRPHIVVQRMVALERGELRQPPGERPHAIMKQDDLETCTRSGAPQQEVVHGL